MPTQATSREASTRAASPAPREPAHVKQAGQPASGGWLDRLQRSSHDSELDYANTSPAFFCMLIFVQTLVTQLVSAALSPRFQTICWMCHVSHWLGWCISVAIKSNKFFDVTEDISYFAIISWSFSTIPGTCSTRQFLVYAGALLWTLRLLSFVGYRIVVRGSDWRFDKLSKGQAYSLFGWTSGGTWCWANGFCLWQLADRVSDATLPLDWLDAMGMFLFVSGLLVEFVADIQKYRFNQGYASGSNSHFIKGGLWAYSRHPNYAGEVMLWAGLSIASLGGTTSLQIRTLLLAAVTPAWSMFFLVFTSLMLLEKRADAKWGGQSDYEEYKRKTPVLFPSLCS